MNPEVLQMGPMYPPTQKQMDESFTLHKVWLAPDKDAMIASVANRISASVVVESSAPVVKELVANAIDACTSRLEVALEGGKGSIQVVDDGCGDRRDLIATISRALQDGPAARPFSCRLP